jgi:NitT/TauT family transport system permease protein
MSVLRRAGEVTASLLLVLGAWHLGVVWFEIPAFLLPPPERVWQALVSLAASGELAMHAGTTLGVVLGGLALGSLLGLACGVGLAKSRAAERWLAGPILFLQTAPKIALAPLFLIWFGLGIASKLVLVVSLVFFPVLVGTMLGIRSVDSRMLDLARLLRLSWWRSLRRIELPAALPSIFAGLRVAAVQAVVGAILAEWMSSRAGLGFLMVQASASYRTPVLFASIAATVVLGIVVYRAVELVERRALAWRAP